MTNTEQKYLSAAILHMTGNLSVPQWVVDVVTKAAQPIDMILFCPHCNTQHIDEPDNEKSSAQIVTNERGIRVYARPWENPPHRTHLCRLDQGGCGWMWRPSDRATNGVAHLESKHRLEMGAPQWEMMAAKRYQETHIEPPVIRGDGSVIEPKGVEGYYAALLVCIATLALCPMLLLL